MFPLLLVMAGGAVGAGARYLTGTLALRALGPNWPWGTLGVNLIGGFAMGLLVGILARSTGGENARLLVGVGMLGGFTDLFRFLARRRADAATWRMGTGGILCGGVGSGLDRGAVRRAGADAGAGMSDGAQFHGRL